MNVNQGPMNARHFMARKNKLKPGNVKFLAGRNSLSKRGLRREKPNISVSTSDRTPKIAGLFRSRFLNTSDSGRTTSTTTPSNTTDSDNSHMIIAICEGRGEAREEVGMAAIDLSRPELGIYQVSDTQGYAQTLAGINLLNPIEILVPLTLSNSRLVHIIKQKFSTLTISSIPRRLFDANMGLHLVHHLCAQIYANSLLDVQHKYYALAATSALINHLETYKHVAIASKSLKVIYLRTEHTTAIDCDTAYRLELIASTRGSNKHASLFGILNNTLTSGGKRFLRANILQPLCKQDLIVERLQSVEELTNSPELLNSLQHILPKFVNVDSILTLCMKTPNLENSHSAESEINYILTLKSVLGAITPLREVLKDIQTPALIKIKENISSASYDKMNTLVLKVIHKDAFPCKGHSGDMQRCFSVRPGINQLLDLTRKSYSHLIDTARELVTEFSEKLSLPLVLNCNANKGFHIVMKLAPHQRKMKSTDFPQEFINVTRHATSFSMTTAKLIQLSKRLRNSQQEIELLSAREIYNVLNDIREDISSLYMLCENIAELDLIQSLAETAKIPNYVKPTFSNDYLDIKASRHPMLEFLMENEPVPNDIFMTKYHNFHIITGPNMSGKSIYIKQVILIQIMAQIGSFVPARKACFRITDRIFARINFDDSIECDASTFQLDVREMKVMIDTLTPTSLVIIDELCRGTVHDEGTAIAWALCEQFLDKTAFVFLTTHFLTLTKLEDMYLNVLNWHMESSERIVGTTTRLKYTYRLAHGVTNLEKYGLSAARSSAIPKSVVTRASEIVDQLMPSVKPIQNVDKSNIVDRLKYNLVAKLEFLESTDQLSNTLYANILNDYNANLQKILTETNSNNSEIRRNIHTLANIAKIDKTTDKMDLVEIEVHEIEPRQSPEKSSQNKITEEIFQNTMREFLDSDDEVVSQDASIALDCFNMNQLSDTTKNSSKLNCLELVCANYSTPDTSFNSPVQNVNNQSNSYRINTGHTSRDLRDKSNIYKTPHENISASSVVECNGNFDPQLNNVFPQQIYAFSPPNSQLQNAETTSPSNERVINNQYEINTSDTTSDFRDKSNIYKTPHVNNRNFDPQSIKNEFPQQIYAISPPNSQLQNAETTSPFNGRVINNQYEINTTDTTSDPRDKSNIYKTPHTNINASSVVEYNGNSDPQSIKNVFPQQIYAISPPNFQLQNAETTSPFNGRVINNQYEINTSDTTSGPRDKSNIYKTPHVNISASSVVEYNGNSDPQSIKNVFPQQIYAISPPYSQLQNAETTSSFNGRVINNQYEINTSDTTSDPRDKSNIYKTPQVDISVSSTIKYGYPQQLYAISSPNSQIQNLETSSSTNPDTPFEKNYANKNNFPSIEKSSISCNNYNPSILAPETTFLNTSSSPKTSFDPSHSSIENPTKRRSINFTNPTSKSRKINSKSNNSESNISNKLVSSFRIIKTFFERTSDDSHAKIQFASHQSQTTTSFIPETVFSNGDGEGINFKLNPSRQTTSSSSSGISHLLSDENNENYERLINNIEQYKPNFNNTKFKYVFRSDNNMENKL